MDPWRQEGKDILSGTCPSYTLEIPGGALEGAGEQGIPVCFHSETFSLVGSLW